MTREHAKQMLPIITAWANGETIQYQRYNGEWSDAKNPAFDNGSERYRIKPKPREWTCRQHNSNGLLAGLDGPFLEEGEIVRVREILD